MIDCKTDKTTTKERLELMSNSPSPACGGMMPRFSRASKRDGTDIMQPWVEAFLYNCNQQTQ